MEEQTVQRVRALLVDAGFAHKEFEEHQLKGVRDEDWPAWYSAYLLSHGLNGLIGREISEGDLTGLLQEFDAAYRRDQPREEWPDYYAQRLVDGG